jgi:cell division septation protein DedD
MERSVKERLVGASLLVAVVVLVVPELLSGPKSPVVTKPNIAEPVRNVTVDLATSRPMTPEPAPASPQPTKPPPALPVSPALLPATGGPAAEKPVLVPATAPAHELAPAPARELAQKPVVVPVPAPAKKPAVGSVPGLADATAAAAASSGRWSVQLGSFASRSNANKLLSELRAKHFSGHMSVRGSGASRRYRVRMGPLGNRDDAEQMAAKLKVAGHGASIVPSD